MDKNKEQNANPEILYPQRFDIKTAPENKHIELSRVFAIAVLGMTAIIIALAAAIYFAKQYQSSSALVIVRNRDSSAWTILENPDKTPGVWTQIKTAVGFAPKDDDNMVQYVMQEYLARDFVRRWFNVAATSTANEAAWKTCVLNKCGDVDENIQGELCCQTTGDVFARFMNAEVPEYRKMFKAKRARAVATDDAGEPDIRARPLTTPNFSGHTMWRLRFDVVDYDVKDENLMEVSRRPVVAFVRVSTNNQTYPKNMGQYVSSFNYFWRD